MSRIQQPVEPDLIGLALANNAVLAMILRVFGNTGAVSSDQVEQHLRDIIGM